MRFLCVCASLSGVLFNLSRAGALRFFWVFAVRILWLARAQSFNQGSGTYIDGL